MRITKIVSGGQTGADRGGWDAAMYCDMPYGGWVPKGRKAEDGVIPAEYVGLVEMPTAEYLARTERNVLDSDATAVFTLGNPTGGSLRTIEFAHAHRKPWHSIDVNLESRTRSVRQITGWLRGEIAFNYDEYTAKPPDECILNVAGSRESKADGIQALVMAIMVDVLREVNPECRRFYPLAG